jgi:hypothetical protein
MSVSVRRVTDHNVEKRIFIAGLLQSSVEAAASTPDHERASPKLGDGEEYTSAVEYSGS